MSEPVRRSVSPSPASATARAASCRASSTTATPTRPSDVPGLMHVELGGYHVGDVEFVAAFDVDAAKVGLDLGKAIFAGQNNTIRFADVPEIGVIVQRAPDARRPRQVLPPDRRGVAGRAGRRRRRSLRDSGADVLVSYLPVGSEEAQKLLRAGAASTPASAFVNAIPVFIASDPVWAQEVHRRGRADRRRRHQEPGRRDHRPPHPRPPVRGPRHGARPHVPAQRRRQHGLQEHARARAPRVQEDLEDPGRHEPDRPRHRGRRRAHRPVGPRAVAAGPQVGLHPPRGPQLRRRAAEPGAQARGLGLPELGRRDHRRGALRQARPGPRHRRPARWPVGVLHEVAAGAVPRRRGVPHGRGVRSRRATGRTPSRDR